MKTNLVESFFVSDLIVSRSIKALSISLDLIFIETFSFLESENDCHLYYDKTLKGILVVPTFMYCYLVTPSVFKGLLPPNLAEW